ncbi:hypothetical protein ABW11_01455 [Pluralibacter gergoviae]|nr:hypothetical protein ABW11_01455 [Pluralibacter gergoviae]
MDLIQIDTVIALKKVDTVVGKKISSLSELGMFLIVMKNINMQKPPLDSTVTFMRQESLLSLILYQPHGG